MPETNNPKLAERCSTFMHEADERLSRFEQTRAAFRAEDVHRYFVAIATGKKVARPKAIKA